MGLIKSSSVPASATPFSMADIEKAARNMLLRARSQAEQLLAAAQQEAEQLKAEGNAQGHATGKAEGLAIGTAEGRAAGHQQALGESRVQLQQAFEALSQATADLDARRIELDALALQDVVQLATAVARRVTKRQGLLDQGVLAANLAEAMALVARQSDLRIAIHPSQRATLDAALPQVALTWPALKHVEIVEDASLAPGGCRVFTLHGLIDADLDAQLDHIVSDLLPEPGGAADPPAGGAP